MTAHFQREIEKLKEKLLQLSGRVALSVEKAVQAVGTCSVELANEVSKGDDAIDQMEIEVEEECLKILALHQPVAIDLRFIVATLKINNDLERIGDLAVHVAHRALDLARETKSGSETLPFDLHGMSGKVISMLNRSIAALVELDAAAARQVCKDDEEVDALNRETFRKMKEQVLKGRPEALTMLYVSRHLERIADHTTNIAEDILYMIDGEIVRHRKFPSN